MLGDACQAFAGVSVTLAALTNDPRVLGPSAALYLIGLGAKKIPEYLEGLSKKLTKYLK